MEFITAQGAEIPALGFGTARFDSNDVCRRAVEVALETGYRHIDTAQMYGTEGAVGSAVAAAEVDRDEVFVTTKLNDDNRSRDRMLDSTKRSLEELRMDTVDLLLIHSPNETVPVEETIGAMNELQDDGAVRHVGVSNFSVDQLRRARDASETPVVTNQVEYHPHRGQGDLLEFCIDENVMLTAYSPLDIGSVMEDTALVEIGNRHGKTAPQVAIRWLLQQEMVSAIPKAAEHEHVRENFNVFDFELSDDEMRRIFEGAGGLSDGLRERLGL
ncbi:aldo/keto reductase [Haladaptatus salinisoli]|uniref:aldo/keto reductase n=1 Tax=Haladaptatus salinisoli TaxID=2884876 RepID=UPI001D0A359F|nr:aldo/keto reductase [Haladaptatus salinisoli]